MLLAFGKSVHDLVKSMQPKPSFAPGGVIMETGPELIVNERGGVQITDWPEAESLHQIPNKLPHT